MAKKRAIPGKKVPKDISYEDPYAAEDKTHDFGTPETTEEVEQQMDVGEKEEEVYSEEGREKLIEDAEIEDWEEGFMEGAEQRGEQHCCEECGKLLGEEETEIIEREFDGEIKWFCSSEHAQKYADKLEKKKEREEFKEE